MTAYTATQSGLASANATWGGGGHPSLAGDMFTIPVGINVTWDLDLTGLANGLGACTINGGFEACTTAGTYGVKCNGTWTFGASAHYYVNNGLGNAYPANCTFTQQFNGNYQNTLNATTAVDIRCQEPTHVFCTLSQAASGGATTLNVDTDLTGAGDSTWWAANALIRVDNINQTQQSEERTIQSVSATQIVITAGLTNSKLAGSKVILISRNVKIVGPAVANGTGFYGGASAYIGAELRLLTYGVYTGSGHTIDGSVSDCTYGVISGISCVVNAALTGNYYTSGYGVRHTFNGLISGSQAGVLYGVGHILAGIISGCNFGCNFSHALVISGIITNCNYGIGNSAGCIITGSILNCNYGLYYFGVEHLLRSATLSGNIRDFYAVESARAYNTMFGSAIEFLNYNTNERSLWAYVESVDHDAVVGAFKAWCRGGIVMKVVTPTYDTSRAYSYQHACESASAYVFKQDRIIVQPGGVLNVLCFVRKTVTMAYLPRLWIFDASKEPFLSGTPDAEAIMTDSVDTWEVLIASITNTATIPREFVIRTLAKNTSGNVFFDPIVVNQIWQTSMDAGVMV